MTITTFEELQRLPRPPAILHGSGSTGQSPAQEGKTGGLAVSPPTWEISPPSNGALVYTVDEVAAITGAARTTVLGWVSRGLRVGGRPVKLHSLRVPRGRIAPGALCAFLGAVNGIQVTVAERGNA